MRNVLIVVDMQNDFIDGALGTVEAQAIVPAVRKKIETFDGPVLFTRDTHTENYGETQEGRNLPVPHCIRGTEGWQIRPELDVLRKTEPIDKPGFGSTVLGEKLLTMDREDALTGITFIGLCTDICVISNVMVAKAFLSEVPITVDAGCCAGVTPATHENALRAMEACQVKIIR